MVNDKVAVYRNPTMQYPTEPPFHPAEDFPEYIFSGHRLIDPENQVYSGVRETFMMLGLDRERAGTREWNPLGAVIKPGDKVVIKPNFVRHFHGGGIGVESLITHGSVIRAVLDYACLALRGHGSIVIGDAPLQQGDWSQIIQLSGVQTVVDFYQRQQDLSVRLVDFRQEMAIKDFMGCISQRVKLGRDPHMNQAIDLEDGSLLDELGDSYPGFRVTNFDPTEMLRHHNADRHEYLIAREVLDADVFINVPKLKTHAKVGITCCLKNIVGINASKDWLPHHTNGASENGHGDAYRYKSHRKQVSSNLLDRIEASNSLTERRVLHGINRAIIGTRRLVPMKDRYLEGSWFGNDTLWRTVLDLNRILLFGDQHGKLGDDRPPRRYVAVVDAIVSGEGEGPTHPTPKQCGVILAGFHPVAVDAVSCLLMGFDYNRIPLIREAVDRGALGEVAWDVVSNYWRDLEHLRDENLQFVPSSGWQGCIELGG